MALLSSWLCTNSTKNMLVKIVYPGGRVELHDRPVLAAEIMQQNPRCCVTYPDVFRNPSAVVAPDTVLMLGQKFYVVPVGTVRKLRRISVNDSHSNSPLHKLPSIDQHTPKRLCSCLSHSDNEPDTCSGVSSKSSDNRDGEECAKDEGCFRSLFTRAKLTPEQGATDGMSYSMIDSSESEENKRKRIAESSTGERKRSPRRVRKNASPTRTLNNWQPSLEIIIEE